MPGGPVLDEAAMLSAPSSRLKRGMCPAISPPSWLLAFAKGWALKVGAFPTV